MGSRIGAHVLMGISYMKMSYGAKVFTRREIFPVKEVLYGKFFILFTDVF